jgi:uncharacterized membrane protein YbhN (UPF0104 family)
MTTSEMLCSPRAAASKFAPTARKVCDSTSKFLTRFWLKALVAGLALLLIIANLNLSSLLASLKIANWRHTSLALILLVPNLLIQGLKWHYLLTRIHPQMRFATSMKSLLVGYPLGWITPGRLGEIGRGLIITSLPPELTIKLAILDKITNLGVNLLAGLAGLLLFPINLESEVKAAGLILSAVLLATCTHPKLKIKLRTQFNISGQNYATLLTLSFFFYAIFLTQFLLLVLTFENINLITGASAAASVFLVKTLLPIAVADLGIREGAAVFFFGKIGVSSAAAFNASLLLFIINLVLPTIVGIYFLLKKEGRAY